MLGFEQEKGQLRVWMTVARDTVPIDQHEERTLNPVYICPPTTPSRTFAGSETRTNDKIIEVFIVACAVLSIFLLKDVLLAETP
jgi:hypothetical protein